MNFLNKGLICNIVHIVARYLIHIKLNLNRWKSILVAEIPAV